MWELYRRNKGVSRVVVIPIVAQKAARPLKCQGGSEVANAQESHRLDRVLGLEIVRVTEATAIAAARLRGRGDEAAADAAAINAMSRELSGLPIQGVIVVGEGEESEAPLVKTRETAAPAATSGPQANTPSDPVEGST